MQGGERRKRARAVRAAERDRLLGPRGVHDGERVGGVRLQRQIVLDRIGDPGVAPVVADDPREAAEPLVEPVRLGERPYGLDV
jgi:hypothetical protein